MDVISTERLQENAAKVGQYLNKECEKLKNSFDIIGDVRGCGLFVGIELVKCRATRTPATAEATYIVDRMKSVHKVLISSDGPNCNVLKLKPPMVFNENNANEFLAAITECFQHVHSFEVTQTMNGVPQTMNGVPQTMNGVSQKSNGTQTNGVSQTNGASQTNGVSQQPNGLPQIRVK